MLTYALRPRARALRHAGGAQDHARRGAQQLPRVVARRRASSTVVPSRCGGGSHDHHQDGVAPADVPPRARRRRSRCRCSMRWCRRFPPPRKRAAKPICRMGFVYVPNGVAMNDSHQLLDAERHRHGLRVLADSGAARAVPRSPDDRQRPRAEAGRVARRRQRRAHARLRDLAERRASRRRPKARTSGSATTADQIAAAQFGKETRAAVDGDDLVGNRSRARRPVRGGLQLRLHEHRVVAVADDARCRSRTTRASCSIGCSAKAARRKSGSTG